MSGSPTPGARGRRQQMVLELSVLHGSLTEAKHPIVVGHYRGDPMVSAESVLDGRLGGQLTRNSRLGVYPGELETWNAFDNPQGSPPGALVVGLGEVGTLTRDRLVRTLVAGLVRWALGRLPATGAPPVPLSLCSLLIGSNGGTTITVEESMTAVVQAVIQANRGLMEQEIFERVHFEQIQFVELFLNLAVEATRALARLPSSPALKRRARERIEIDPLLQRGEGGRPASPASPYASGWNRRLAIASKKDGGDHLEYEAFTDQARTEIFRSDIQWPAIEEMLESARLPDDAGARRTLFTYLFPPELAESAARDVDTVLILDSTAAQVPWELLDPGSSEDERPLGSRIGILRQLRVERSPTTRRARDRRALVIGNPRSPLPSLLAATDEGKEVAKVLEGAGFAVTPLIESAQDEIVRALYQTEYDILHIAAHGEYFPENVRGSGVVLENMHLTSIELSKLPAVPSIVFLNCCHLAQVDQPLRLEKPGRLAASLATHLIGMGVKVVVAAGWAVNDVAGRTFALTLYLELLGGRTLMAAVKEARQATYVKYGYFSNTWGAYQVYGDPGFVVPSSEERPQVFVSPEELIDRLIVIRAEAKNAGGDTTRLSALGAEVQQSWSTLPAAWRKGAVLNAFGDAWGDLGEFGHAIAAYHEAILSDQRQSKFPPDDNWNSRFSGGLGMVQTPDVKGDWIGFKPSGEEVNEAVESRGDVVVGRGESRNGREDGTKIP